MKRIKEMEANLAIYFYDEDEFDQKTLLMKEAILVNE